MVHNLEENLNNLWGATILEYNMDLFRNNLNMQLKLLDGGNESFHTLNFKNISTAYFLNDVDDFKYVITDMEYLELTAIELLDEESPLIFQGNAQNNSKVNVIMEIWNQVLFLETNSIEVDGIEFEL
ncbi:YxiG family protein [Streptococcus pluranimalium]|uniref:Uncharacterized protein n=1 Tax=Streptococcus pluranimalium TaxID=82348 RepID=A0A2L0D541_9STRE|nr:hypothetical protein [Streptococcus pluranimalium]AUW96719.1 hypothetical protein C0J00_06140 [Streptococcus pluranimalium]